MSDRIYSIDAMRIVAMAFIITIYTDPFRGIGAYGNTLNFVIYSSARFAVPFFFVTSGYLFARKIARRDPVGYFADRAATITSIYAFGHTIATALVTLSLFLFLLSRPTLGAGTPLPDWGKYAVGVYVAHPAVLFALETAAEVLEAMGYEIRTTLPWHVLLTPATFFGALVVYVGAHRVAAIEVGGSHLPSVRSIGKYVQRQ